MKVACESPNCVRGLVHAPGGWADPCGFCNGAGSVPFAELCRRLGEHESTVRRILDPRARMRPRTTARILDKIIALSQARS